MYCRDLPRVTVEDFPFLKNHIVTSRATPNYNCIAWACGVNDEWYWPGPGGAWPSKPRECTIEAFQALFVSKGYEVCADGNVEAGFEKVAVFCSEEKEPTHAARQLPNGRWTSKLGSFEDIEHDLHEVSGPFYGQVRLFLKRSLER